jgi:hypothetical protein
VEKLAETLGVTKLSKSQVSETAAFFDEQVAAFGDRPLDSAHYTFVWADALTIKTRERGRVVNVHALLAVGVNAEGHWRCWGWTWTAARMVPGGRRSCVVWSSGGCAGGVGHLRCPPGPGRRRRCDAAGCQLAALPDPLRPEFAGQVP